MTLVPRVRWRRFDTSGTAAHAGWETVPRSTGDDVPLIRIVSWLRGEWHIQHRESPDANFADGWHWVDVLVPQPGAPEGYTMYLECSTMQEARAAAAANWDFIAEQARGLLAEGLSEIAEWERKVALEKARDEQQAQIKSTLDEIGQQLDAAGVPAAVSYAAAPFGRPPRISEPDVRAVMDDTEKALDDAGIPVVPQAVSGPQIAAESRWIMRHGGL